MQEPRTNPFAWSRGPAPRPATIMSSKWIADGRVVVTSHPQIMVARCLTLSLAQAIAEEHNKRLTEEAWWNKPTENFGIS